MKKIFLIIGAVFLLFGFSFIKFNNSRKILKPKRTKENKIYYWFSVRVSIKEDKNLRVYKIGGSSGIQKGTLKEFEKAIWEGLAKRQIVVGAFQDMNSAKNARLLYKSSKEKIKKIPEINGTLYWFAIHFEESERMRIYILRRTKGAVRQGDVNYFINAFFEQLTYQLFPIGPFLSYEEAEDMKSIYRKNE